MRATTLYQPWAWLWIHGHKGIETRPRRTQPGPILVHAALADTPAGRHVYDLAVNKFNLKLPPWEELGFGKILGIVTITGTQATSTTSDLLQEDPPSLLAMRLGHSAAQELAFGNYAPGRQAWLSRNPEVYEQPIPARGMQGIWNYDGPLPERIYGK